ncbi:MAG: hypothetical protein DRI61_14420, partial [Chloroflexi bacterium]
GVKLSVLWDGNRFITCDNLDYLAQEGQLGKPVREPLKRGATLTIEEPVGYGAPNKVLGTFTLAQDAAEIPNSEYTPTIPILAEPRTFMALVPADKALEVVKAIKAKYEREMGKVRNRLPLHIGIVYAHRRMPLRAILDAGRRMLKRGEGRGAKGKGLTWQVVEFSPNRPLPELEQEGKGELVYRKPKEKKGKITDQFDQWHKVVIEREIAGQKRSLTWYVPALMGDGKTEDWWYPYVFWQKDKANNADPSTASTHRSRYFKVNGNLQLGWVVHAAELKKGDTIYFTPATFDWVWLDSASRRFEIAYGDDGQRLNPAFKRRPYLLDELDFLERIWDTLRNHLTRTQIHALCELIGMKREEWNVKEVSLAEFDDQGNPIPPDDVFWQFCYEALANAEWRKDKGKFPWGDDKTRHKWLACWANYAACGWLTDAVELHLQIMKEEV